MARKKRIRTGTAKDSPLFAGGMLNPADRAYMKSEFLHASMQPDFDIEEWHAGDVASAMKSDSDQTHAPKAIDNYRDMLNEGNFKPAQRPLPEDGTGLANSGNFGENLQPVGDAHTDGLEDTTTTLGLETEATA